jgi:hypothetical protein
MSDLALSASALVLSIGTDSLTLNLCAVVSIKGDTGPAGGTGTGDTLSAKSNGGSTVYPTSQSFAIVAGVTIVDVAAADYDSVRMFGASPEIAAAAWQTGRIINATNFVVDFYPLPGKKAIYCGNDYGADIPFGMAAHSAITWVMDESGNVQLS